MAVTPRSIYRFELHHPTAGMIADLSHLCTSRKFSLSLNREEKLDISFNARMLEDHAATIGMNLDEMIGVGVNEIKVWRANKPLFGTRVRYTNTSISESGEDLSLRATGYLDDLVYRYLWPVEGEDGGVTRYEDTDIGQIMWDMIDTTQQLANGDLGITQGQIQASRTMTDDWQPFATSIRDILIAITERINSVDFSFSYDKKLNVYYPYQGRVHTDLLFTYPGNIVSMDVPQDATQIVNVSINRGSGNGLDITPIETRTDTDSMAAYGRMEQIDDYADVSVPATLQDFGDESLRTFAAPLVIPEVTLRSGKEPPLGAYWLGDWVRFDIPNRSAFATVHNQLLRIVQIQVSLNDLDTEEVRLTVANQ